MSWGKARRSRFDIDDIPEAEMATLPYNLGCEPIAVSLCYVKPKELVGD
ncbi:MAG: hypothetical protein RIE73_22055 [Coleofasciculus sp. C1-SOL-03]